MPDTRESPVKETVKELMEFNLEIYGYDPRLSKEEIETFDVNALNELNVKDVKMDCVIVTTAHEEFKHMKLEDLARMMNNKPVLIDVRGMFDGEEAREKGFYYRRV